MKFPRIVYAIRHNKTGRIYVGSTSSPKSRIMSHLNAIKGGYHYNELMNEDYVNYGDDYSVFILDVSTSIYDTREFIWMDYLNTRDPKYGYNQKDQSNSFSLSRKKEYRLQDADPDDEGLRSFAKDAKKILDPLKGKFW